jgi:alpha-glucosidase (family GH31 glycosyl hydrolase)
MWHTLERGETYTGFWWENPKEKDQLEDEGVDGIKMDLREIGWGACGMSSPGSGQGSLAGCCKCGDERLGSGATELASYSMSSTLQPWDQSIVTSVTSAP